MGSSASTLENEMTSEIREKLAVDLKSQCENILKKNSDNRCCKYVLEYLDTDECKKLSNDDVKIFFKCIRTGIDNTDSGLGCYAMTPTDYKKFGFFFNKVIRDYHGDISGEKKHVTNWDTGSADYDVKKLGLDELSMRVRVGRNLTGFNLPGAMDKDERIRFEKRMLPAFDQLIDKYGGKVHSLTPTFGDEEVNPNLISSEEYKKLVDEHVMFKDMAVDPYLNSAGISNDWPFGRGCWQSSDKMRIIWFGEEDQLRIMCLKKGSNLLEVFTNLNEMLKTVEGIGGIEFAMDENYGYVTSCPSNLGTGMRASVHVKIPKLTADGTDTKAKAVCKPLGLSVRGTGGEHTPIGADGTVDISPSARLFIKESEIIEKLYEGIEKLMAIENPTGVVNNIADKLSELSVACLSPSTSMAEKSPRSLNLAPSPVLAITAAEVSDESK
mmetsp:Transcript_41144/g.48060  ORF Transcript_41144/g.48060 Transcript_41144/m.48060 type:complete len:440 (+) Transcript_41144:81-1400(+)